MSQSRRRVPLLADNPFGPQHRTPLLDTPPSDAAWAEMSRKLSETASTKASTVLGFSARDSPVL